MIALKDVLDWGFLARAIILVIVALLLTYVVYGVVALIVKMDDVGLRMAHSNSRPAKRIGRGLVTGMPKLLAGLSVVGTAAMLWVGGHIVLVGADEHGWHGPYDRVHSLEDHFHDLPGIGGILGWLVKTLASAIVGLAVGALVVAFVSRLRATRRDALGSTQQDAVCRSGPSHGPPSSGRQIAVESGSQVVKSASRTSASSGGERIRRERHRMLANAAARRSRTSSGRTGRDIRGRSTWSARYGHTRLEAPRDRRWR